MPPAQQQPSSVRVIPLNREALRIESEDITLTQHQSIHEQLTPNAISAANQRIAGHVRQTPLISVDSPNGPVQLKLEYLQRAGTFKARGAFNGLLSYRERNNGELPRAGLLAASGGNHGIAVATAAQVLGIAANIFVPTISSAAKVKTLQRLGAIVHQIGDRYNEALEASLVFQAKTGALALHAYDQLETLQGQGTVALEWEQQNQLANLPALDTVMVAVGGGGLIGGMAAWWQGRVKVIAVESEGCATLNRALQAGEPTDGPVGGLAADSLGATRVGSLMFPIAQAHVAQSVLVSDTAIAQAQTWAWQQCRIASEPGGVAALAALLSGAYQPTKGERVGVLMCGANVELAKITE